MTHIWCSVKIEVNEVQSCAYLQEGVSDDAILLLLGNKMDLAEETHQKAVTMKDGSHLADVSVSHFFCGLFRLCFNWNVPE